MMPDFALKGRAAIAQGKARRASRAWPPPWVHVPGRAAKPCKGALNHLEKLDVAKSALSGLQHFIGTFTEDFALGYHSATFQAE
jgi:hypothetical protein